MGAPEIRERLKRLYPDVHMAISMVHTVLGSRTLVIGNASNLRQIP